MTFYTLDSARLATQPVISIVMVRSGSKYGPEYVDRLVHALKTHLPKHYSYCLVLLTDQTGEHDLVSRIYYPDVLPPTMRADNDNGYYFGGWWPKLIIFDRTVLGWDTPILYIDLDTVVIGTLEPLIKACEDSNRFLISRNFTKMAGHTSWPCNYGSCLMYLPPAWGYFVWQSFVKDGCVKKNIQRNPKGDQQYIQRVYPNARFFQDVLPEGYIIGRRDFTNKKPDGASIMVFAGPHKPHNTPCQWLRDAWYGN